MLNNLLLECNQWLLTIGYGGIYLNDLQARDRILIAAKELFSKKGYEKVTVREIAKKANCSHTSMYVFFKDKRNLLEELAKEPLDLLTKELKSIISKNSYSAIEKLIRSSQTFVHFGLSYRNLYQAFMNYDSTRVDIPNTKWELNESRLLLFDLLKFAVAENFPKWDEEQLIEFSRIIYYMLHGIILTYQDVEEEVIQIERRVFPIVKQSINYLVLGVISNENS